MNTTIFEAIPTEYKNIKFRSRLEARWAIFFDEMGIKYEYEREGFGLKDGSYYVPDFKLHVKCRSSDPNGCVYAEVKGVWRGDSRQKVIAFAENHPIIVLGAVPTNDREWIEAFNSDPDFFSYSHLDGDGYCALFSIYNGEPWICGADHDQWDGGETMNAALVKARFHRFDDNSEAKNKSEDSGTHYMPDYFRLPMARLEPFVYMMSDNDFGKVMKLLFAQNMFGDIFESIKAEKTTIRAVVESLKSDIDEYRDLEKSEKEGW